MKRQTVVTTARRLVRKGRRRAKTGQVKVIERAFGRRAANRYFWQAPGREQTWYDVRRRLDHLDGDQRERDHFVASAIEATANPDVVVGLARYPVSQEALRRWLHDHAQGAAPDVLARVGQDPLLGGAFIGAGRLLLDTDRARAIEAWVVDATDVLDARMFEFADSMGYRAGMSTGADEPVPEQPAPDREVVRRLVLADYISEPDSTALVLHGAKQATLLAAADTFGRFDPSPFESWPGIGDVTVEHIRTRIPRFSQEYIDLHEATAALAHRLVAEVATIPDALEESDRPFLVLEVADFLFFQALKVRAIDLLLDDAGFDHVVVALAEHAPNSEFVRLLSGIERLRTDSRVEFVSVSHDGSRRAQFRRTVDVICRPTPVAGPLARVPVGDVMRKLDDQARLDARRLGRSPNGGDYWTLLVTTNNAAYNQSTAVYADEIREQGDVRILHLGAHVEPVESALAERATPIPIDVVVPPETRRLAALAELMQDRLRAVPSGAGQDESVAQRAAAWAAVSSLTRLTTSVIAPALLRLKANQRWFASLREARELPGAVVLTPQRAPAVGAFAAVARRFGIPSISVEPHAQDANYSRYVKVSTDYYGVMSDYFRHAATVGFGIAADRVRTIGSPRQVAPAGYEPLAAQRAARADLARATGVEMPSDVVHLAFFCQPSEWNHVSKVWSNILEACGATGSLVLLKTHPEESPSRVQQYLDQAQAQGAADRVIHLDGDAETAVSLADIVATAYSTSAFDAAVRQTPVICVTDGDERYPLDIPAIVDAPLATSAGEIAEILRAFRDDPDQMRTRARRLLEREPQFLDGPGRRLRQLVSDAGERGGAGIRRSDELPASLFLDRPHPTFRV